MTCASCGRIPARLVQTVVAGRVVSRCGDCAAPRPHPDVLCRGLYDGRRATLRLVEDEVVLYGGEDGLVQSMRPLPNRRALASCVATLFQYFDPGSQVAP